MRLGPTLAVITLALVGCSEKGEPEPGRHGVRDMGFSIRFPEGWEVKENARGAAIIGMRPRGAEGEGFRESVAVYVENLPGGVDLKKYFDLSAKGMSGLVAEYAALESGASSVGGREAMRLAYTGSQGSHDMHNVTYLAVNDGRGYAITCFAAPETFEAYAKTFDEIVASFRFE